MLAEPRADRVAAGGRPRARRRPDLAALGPDQWLVAAITAAAALLRFATITSQSFWVDEATTVHEVGLSLGQMLHELRLNETTPPLYFVVAWVWTRVFGAGELGIRSLSALAGVILVPVAYLCGRELVSRAAGVLTALLVAVSPFMIWYSQEARAYMLFALLSALSFLFAARAARTRRTSDVGLWGVCSALAILTHFFAGFLIAPEALWLLWVERTRIRTLLVTSAGVAAVQIAMLPIAIGDTSHPLHWLQTLPLSARIEETPTDFAVSQLYLSAATPAGAGLLGAAGLVAVGAGLLWLGGGSRERRGAALAAGLGVLVVFIPVVLAWLGHDYVYNRNFIAAWVPLAVALGAVCTVPRARVAGVALAAVVVVGFIWAGVVLAADPWVQRLDWRGAAAALGRPLGPRLIVTEDGNAAEQPLAIYLPHTQFSYTGWPTGSPAVTVSELDVVGDPPQATYLDSRLPAGVELIETRMVSVNIQVWRFALSPAWHLSTVAIAARAQALFGESATANPTLSVLFQR